MPPLLVKICGLQSLEAAEAALDAGADLLGVILVPGRSRTVDTAVAKQIALLVRQRRLAREKALVAGLLGSPTAREKSGVHGSAFYEVTSALASTGPHLVGVVQNQLLALVNALSATIGLDYIQLHGAEPRSLSAIQQYAVPVISRVVLTPATLAAFESGVPALEDNHLNLGLACVPGNHALVLMDSEAGGEGKVIDWSACARFFKAGHTPFVLAGGLTPQNVQAALAAAGEGAVGVDVSGGVETNGIKDLDKIRAFVTNAKQGRVNSSELGLSAT